jgi:hypothetical protein
MMRAWPNVQIPQLEDPTFLATLWTKDDVRALENVIRPEHLDHPALEFEVEMQSLYGVNWREMVCSTQNIL